MRIQHLRLADFRNISFAEVALGYDRVFLLGCNGQGKTNLLEAVGLLPALRSFRTQETGLLVRHGCPAAQLGYSLRHEQEGDVNITFSLTPKQKTVTVDGEKVRQFSAYLGRFPVVAFCADDIDLLRGSPTGRRRWLDLAISAGDPGYLEALRRYYGALAGRNQLLRQAQPDANQLLAFEKAMAPCAVRITTRRKEILTELGLGLEEACACIGLADGASGLVYSPNVMPDDIGAWLEVYQRQRPSDIMMRATQRGPHRDDFDFRFSGRHAQDVASEGQQRGLVLGLSLSLLAHFRRQTQTTPIVLADDILGELDPVRKEGFWKALGSECQVLATGTVLPADVDSWHVITVSDGHYS
ncbi:MAG: DNA replication and repair protein RecF [Puniceicoccales bacterium]|jgi:DNA replication and repair protein RecF|nr:DNA replication and repair protein RecF [Puniceicoccales bacterium]